MLIALVFTLYIIALFIVWSLLRVGASPDFKPEKGEQSPVQPALDILDEEAPAISSEPGLVWAW